MTIRGQTRCFAVFGSPVRHSLSPLMHNAALRKLGMDAVYVPFEISANDLPGILPVLGPMGFGGVNLTIPLKECAFRQLPDLDESAARLGAVNTIAFENGRTRGYNTDGEGFLRDLEERAAIAPEGRNILIVGCGGAGRAIAITCASRNAARITLFNRTASRAREVARVIRNRYPRCEVEPLSAAAPEPLSRAALEADLVVQCTSVGMHAGDASPLPPELFHPGQVVYDLVYTSPRTVTMAAAQSSGARAFNGLGMLLHQGAASFRIWTGHEPDTALMRHILESELYENSPSQETPS